MPRYQVRVAPRAQAQIDEVAAWWKTNRQAAPTLVVDEFEAAGERLTFAPLSGAIYRQTVFRSVRRLLLPRIRYHIYYEIDEPAGVVRVVAFWHAARAGGHASETTPPSLGRCRTGILWKASLRLGRLLGRRFRRQFEPRQFVHGAPPVSQRLSYSPLPARIPASDC